MTRYTIRGLDNDRARRHARRDSLTLGERWRIVLLADRLRGIGASERVRPVHRERVRLHAVGAYVGRSAPAVGPGEGPAGSGPENAYKCAHCGRSEPVGYVIAWERRDTPGTLYSSTWTDLQSALDWAEPSERVWGLVPVEGPIELGAKEENQDA